jgi:sugar lactone lactonase YvrE
MVRKAVLFVAICLTSIFCEAQVKVGEWREHLSYNPCNSVAKAGNLVYVSNGVGLLKYNLDDNSVERLNKINGLSDIGIVLLRYNPGNRTLLVIYEDANIDVIKDDKVINFPDIKLKTITGKKNINEVFFQGNLAYLSCGFGIVLFDTDKLEVKDTYYIGASGAYVNVYQVAFTDTTIFAATSVGVKKANLSTLLNNFQNWKTVTGIPAGTYNGVVKYLDRIVVNYSPYAVNDANLWKDTLYGFDGYNWSKEILKPLGYSIRRLTSGDNNYLGIVDVFGYEVHDKTEAKVAYMTNYSFGYAKILDACIDVTNSQPEYWLADNNNGLVHSYGSYPYYPNIKLSLNGTHSNYISNIDIFQGKVLCAPIPNTETGSAHYSREGLNYYDGQEWQYVKETFYDSIMDFNHVVIDRKDPSHFWASSWVNGLCEFKNNNLVKVYNSINCVIPHIPNYYDWHRTSGLCMDKDGNLWIGSSDVQNFLSVRKSDGTFQNFDFNSITAALPQVGRVLADKNGQVWVCFPRGDGIAVYKTSGYASPNSSNAKILKTAIGQGKLPDTYVYAIAEDLDGKIWIGTAKGIAVFYNPGNVFNGGNFDCQQILITQDTHVQILLETEKVTAIAVDGANRKWVGTESSGLFCFSPDGQTQIYHFTEEDSPLFSNNIIDIAYDGVSGDIFVGTEQGLQSYRTSIIDGEENYTGVHAYPNPVKPNYSGNVYVRGLVDQSVVKITDVAGNLVWEAKSQGGQIEWNLRNLSGQKVASGVYTAFCATTDGSKSTVTKILVVN